MKAPSNLLKGILESSKGNVIFALDRDYCYLTFNENHKKIMEDIWGFDIKVGYNILDFIKHQEDRNKAKVNFDRALSGESLTIIEEYCDKSINRRWYQNEYNPLYDDSGTIIGLTVFMSDITELKQAEEALKQEEKLLRAYFEKVPAGISIIDKNGNFLDVNSVLSKVLELSKTELMNHNIFDFIDESYHQTVKNGFNQLEEQDYMTGEVIIFTMNAKRVWAEIHASKMEEKKILAFSIDITGRKQAEESIRYMAFHDSLTGLYNRNYFNRESTNIDHESQLPLGIIMADINGLKLINDTYGQHIGDELLKYVADIVKNSCRKEDIVIRWGGDEIVILSPNISRVELEELQKSIKKDSQNTYIKDLPISLALGIEIKEKFDVKIEQAIKQAEDNLQKQKLSESRSEKNSILKAMLNTLQAKSNETEVHTQRMLMVAWKIGDELGLSDHELNRLQLVITLHDIGKINISENTLTKKDQLSDEEWEEIKKHPEIGYKIARSIDEFSHVAKDILCHHEKWDGTGYPNGFQGQSIPLLARITAIADAYEVMSNGRPYKEPMDREAIIAEFKSCAGTQFDPELVEMFLNMLKNQTEI